jgi:hypothetical protein
MTTATKRSLIRLCSLTLKASKQTNKKSAFFSSKVFRFGKNTLAPQKKPPSFMDNQMGKNDVNNDA